MPTEANIRLILAEVDSIFLTNVQRRAKYVSFPQIQGIVKMTARVIEC